MVIGLCRILSRSRASLPSVSGAVAMVLVDYMDRAEQEIGL